MPRTHCKPQQQTLSIRVSESYENSLNCPGKSSLTVGAMRCRYRIPQSSFWNRRRRFAWISAWRSELQQSRTLALGQIRRKWERQQPLSRSEWVLLAQYVQVACEKLSGTTTIPSADSFIAVLEALLAVRSLSTAMSAWIDST
jgi:hypothetical protein